MPLDLPIDDVKVYVNDLLDQIGKSCTIDGISTKIMLSDLEYTRSFLEENMKQAVIPQGVSVHRGSKVLITDSGLTGIVYTNPNDDLVSLSVRLLICNSSIQVKTYVKVYDKDTGDLTGNTSSLSTAITGFIERVSATEKQYDMGLLHETVLRFITFAGASIKMDDSVQFNNKNYKVIDINELTDGLLMVQLANG